MLLSFFYPTWAIAHQSLVKGSALAPIEGENFGHEAYLEAF